MLRYSCVAGALAMHKIAAAHATANRLFIKDSPARTLVSLLAAVNLARLRLAILIVVADQVQLGCCGGSPPPAFTGGRGAALRFSAVPFAAISSPAIARSVAAGRMNLTGIDGDDFGARVPIVEPFGRRRRHQGQMRPHELTALVFGQRRRFAGRQSEK